MEKIKVLIKKIENEFGESLKSAKLGYPNNIYFTLENEYTSMSTCLSYESSDSYNDMRIKEIKDEFDNTTNRKKEIEKNEKMLNEYLKQLKNEDLTIQCFRQVIEYCNANKIVIGYVYDLINVLSEFRLTNKSIIAIDPCNNKVMFNSRQNNGFTFSKCGIVVLESEE